MQVQKGQQNKNYGTKIGKCKCKKVSRTKIVEQKLVGTSRPLGDRDPKCKCKRVNGTKIAEQKLQNKNSRTKIAEQKWSGTKTKMWNKN